MFPGGDLGDELIALFDAPVETLAAQYANLDLDHVEPAGVLWGVMELDALEDAACFGSREGLVEGASGMGREVVENDADQLGVGVVDIDQLAHALGEVARGPLFGNLDLAPGPVRINEDEQVGGAVATVLAVITFEPTGHGRDRLTDFADELGRALVEANDRPLGASA